MTIESRLDDLFGAIDIYLFDQILKRRFRAGQRILDAGCGSGRNLPYFLQNGYDVHAVDRLPEAVEQVITLAARLAPQLPQTHFRTAAISALPFAAAHFDAVICSAVLHFAESSAQFEKMVDELWRVLKPGGFLFARLASTIGLASRMHHIDDRRYRLPDGSERYLVDDAQLRALIERLDASLLDPIKTTNVHNLRCMTTIVLSKP